MMEMCRWKFDVGVMVLLLLKCVSAVPLPAPLLPDYCNSEERCCMPRPYTGKPVRQFEFNASLPFRFRRAAHLLDEAYIAKYERALELQRALPDTDPRSFKNQQMLHCLYCDNGIYYPNSTWPLEIHGGWHFLPWHRMYTYFNERILAKLLDDDTFALPYWNWDNQTPEAPFANIVPYMYARNKSSSLWNKNRNNCSQPPFTVALNTKGGCEAKTPEQLRTENDRLMYTQLVTGAPTPNLFFGMPYSLGDAGPSGAGKFEDAPHGSIHFWMGDPSALYEDMGNPATASRDPIFFSHHANIDRIWNIWKSLGGKQRKDPSHPDFLDGQYTLYDENGDLVVVNASQTLNSTLLRYDYEEMPAAWTTNGELPGFENNISKCSQLDTSQLNAMIGAAPFNSPSDVCFKDPYTFRVARPPLNHPNATNGTEVLEIVGIDLDDIHAQAHWLAYLFHPYAVADTSAACPEYIGLLTYVPHVGMAMFRRPLSWRVAIGEKLVALGKENYTDVLVTIAQFGPTVQPIRFANVSISYDMS